MHLARLLLVPVLVVVTGCMPGYIAPAAPLVRPETRVQAPFDSTWSAVVGFFAERNIQIRTIEKASGIIVAETTRADNLRNREMVTDARGRVKYRSGRAVEKDGPALYAECGTYRGYNLDPVNAAFNVRVTGDANASAFRVNAKFSTRLLSTETELLECSSVGNWEQQMEDALRSRLGK